MRPLAVSLAEPLTNHYTYLHDGLDLVGEWDSNGNLQAYWTWGLGLISQRRATTSSWYHFDRMGNVKQLTNSAQTVTDTYDTDAWGANGSSSGSTVNPFRFGGQFAYFTDPDSGLLRLGVRYLDPANGRFTERDPASRLLLPYAYVANHPTSAKDPTGLAKECDEYEYYVELRIRWNTNPPFGSPESGEEIYYSPHTYLQVPPCNCSDDERLVCDPWGRWHTTNRLPIYDGPGAGVPYTAPGVWVAPWGAEVDVSMQVPGAADYRTEHATDRVRIDMWVHSRKRHCRCVKRDCAVPWPVALHVPTAGLAP